MNRFSLVVILLAGAACEEAPLDPAHGCVLSSDAAPASADRLGCPEDFLLLSSLPLDATIPSARSVKTVLDRADQGRLYFQNSKQYAIHWSFAREHLSGAGRPIVLELSQFNEVEYYSPDRRFILGAVTHYEGPDIWSFELAPYDTADASMIVRAFRAIASASFIGDRLCFHPTSEALSREAEQLPADIRVVSTEELFDGIDYQPLNLAHSMGRLRFVNSEEYLDFRDIVVLDQVPNDISVVSGIITTAFQTPLSHINVLSQNRGTPNMALREAQDVLRRFEGQWVSLRVSAFDYQIRVVEQSEADAWWEANRPATVQVPTIDLSRQLLADIPALLNREVSDREALSEAIPAFGGKASHYAILATIPELPVPKAFAIPIFFYDQFLEQNGFKAEIESMLTDERFRSDPRVRDTRLRTLRDAMKRAPVDEDLLRAVHERLSRDYPGVRMRFRSSTNAEDLDGFTGAGLYTSKSGDPSDPAKPVVDAIRKVWASVWRFRAFEERSYRNISHLAVGMAILVHRSFPDEYANGVALTANPFDPSGLEPGFYVNVQRGEASVVKPQKGVTSDQLIYQFDRPGQPIIYIGHSNLVPPGDNVLTTAQIHQLGVALDKIHKHFRKTYGPPLTDPTAWYAMDVELKFDEQAPGLEPTLFIKQARPHPGRGDR